MNIGIVGFGNLGRSLASGLIKSGSIRPDGLFICDNSPPALSDAENTGALASQDVNYIIKNSDVIFLTVKSYVFEEMSKLIDKTLLSGKTVVSFMAGMKQDKIAELSGNDVTIIRAMPSLAIASCDGVIGYTKAPEEVELLFKKLGFAFETDPDNIEKVMAFSSCGLGFAAYLIEAFANSGLTMGFSKQTCDEIAARTFKNAIDRGGYMDTVKAVATPGGATEQGVLHMECNDIFGIVTGAVSKAYDAMK